MLDSPETAVVVKACQALHKFVKKCKTGHGYHSCMHLTLQISLSLSLSPSLSLLAAEQCCVEMTELGVVPRLVRLLADQEKATRAYAVLCLSAMTPTGIPELSFKKLIL